MTPYYIKNTMLNKYYVGHGNGTQAIRRNQRNLEEGKHRNKDLLGDFQRGHKMTFTHGDFPPRCCRCYNALPVHPLKKITVKQRQRLYGHCTKPLVDACRVWNNDFNSKGEPVFRWKCGREVYHTNPAKCFLYFEKGILTRWQMKRKCGNKHCVRVEHMLYWDF
jgi:hypothetical protein